MTKSTELTGYNGQIPKTYYPWLVALTVGYGLAVGGMCFMPQPILFENVQTPNIIYWGRLRLLLVPFNSLLGLGQLDSLFEVFWIFTQNALNVFLLFPLILGLLFLKPQMRTASKATLTAFGISVFIEVSQLMLDILIDANRVFEIDDLWTNTLGGYLAFIVFSYLVKRFAILT